MEWLILYKKKGKREESLVCMPTIAKLLKWIEKNASSCEEVRIRSVEG